MDASAKKKTFIKIRKLTRLADFEKLLDIQRQVWQHDEADLTPVHQFRITSRMGAIILGGFIDGRLAGFVYSFPAIFGKKLIQHSHLLAVLPEYRGYGLGKKLKWAQREMALRLGYDLITWTVDPLQAKNANLNIHTLGATCRTYWRDFYGLQPALLLGPNIPTDRLLMEWQIKEKSRKLRPLRKLAVSEDSAPPKAVAREFNIGGKKGRGHLRQAGTGAGGMFALPGKPRLSLNAPLVLAEVPPAVNELRRKPDVIAAWQRALRRAFEHYFERCYIIDDFIFGDRCFYVLRRGNKRPV
jgi:predicted GNAT superfamily acetyltransferase